MPDAILSERSLLALQDVLQGAIARLHVYRALLEDAEDSIEALHDEAEHWKPQAEHGEKFKAFVHDKLDAAGVPRFEHMTCRVGARLDWLILKAMSAPGAPAGTPDHA